jgi:hypothetical protein
MVPVPEPRSARFFGPSSLRWLRPATAIVAIALVVLLMGDFLHAFENNAGVNSGGNATYIQVAPSPANTEQQTMVAVPGIMGQMSLATAKAVGYTDYTVVGSVPLSEQQTMVAVPGVMGQMSLATAKAVGYTDYTVIGLAAVSQPATPPNLSVPGNEGPTGTSAVVQGKAGVGWPLRQAEIGLGATVFVLLVLMIFARRQRRARQPMR